MEPLLINAGKTGVWPFLQNGHTFSVRTPKEHRGQCHVFWDAVPEVLAEGTHICTTP